MTKPTERVYRPRHAGYYPLLLSGLDILEYLSVDDCQLIADALDISLNPNRDADQDVRELRLRQLAERFARGARG